MTIKHTFYATLFFLLPFLALAQQEEAEWISTEAIIKDIERKRAGKKAKEIATVLFATQQGDSMKAYVELIRIPFVGTFRSPGDKITIKYKKDTPAMAETLIGRYISEYGMYVLIGLGIIISGGVMMRARRKAA